MLQKVIQREKFRYQWVILSLVLCLQLLVKGVRTDGEGFLDQQDRESLSRVLTNNFGPPSRTNGAFAGPPPRINDVNGYQGRYYSDGSFIGTGPNVSPGTSSFERAQSYNGKTEMSGYLVDPYGSRSQGGPGGNTYNVIYSNDQEKKIPLFLSKSPLVVSEATIGGGSNTKPSYNTSNRQEVNKYFSPYSSIHYLSSPGTTSTGNSRWVWNHIEKPILRTSTTRPVEFKHKVPNMDEAWWNVSYNVRKEPRRSEGSESAVQNLQVESQSTASGEKIESSDSKVTAGSEDKAQAQSQSQNHSHSHNHKHGHSHRHGGGRKDHEMKDKDVPQEDEVLKSATIGDIVNLTRLEVPNPYDRKVAIDQLISTSLDNLKQENWSIPVEEIINATFIHPGTQQPDLVPNQMGPKVKVQDFYCNPQIHKCTNLHAVGTAIGEPIWKIYNTSTVGRAQRRVSNLLDDTEKHLTMGLTKTFVDYIEQEPTIELLESIAKAPSNIFQIPENGSITQFYDNTTRLGFFQTSEFISPLPQNKTDQKFANALKKAAIDCLLSNFTLPNCHIPENNTENEQIYGNRSIYQLFKDPNNLTF